MPSNRDALIGAGTALNWPWQDGKFAALHGLDRLGTPWFPVRLEPSMGRNYLPSGWRKRLRARSPRQAAVSTLAYVHDSGRSVDLGPSSAVPTLSTVTA